MADANRGKKNYPAKRPRNAPGAKQQGTGRVSTKQKGFRRPSTPRAADAEVASRPTRSSRALREDLVLQAALEAYGSVIHEGRLADRALDFTLRHKKNLYANERRAVAERVYALLRRERTIDFLLSRTHPRFASLSAGRQDALRLATARTMMGEQLEDVMKTSGVAPEDNRALERLPEAARELKALPFEERFPISAAIPDFLARRFLEQFGDQAEAAAEAMNERAPLTARVNSLVTTREALIEKLKAEGVEARPTPLSPYGLHLETRINAFSLEAFREGLFEIQDEGSQLLGMLVDAPPKKVVDACAGSGGKTLQLAAQMKNRGELFAFDIEERRIEEMRKRTRRAGAHNVRVRVIPAEGPEADASIQDLVDLADRVMVDAPCSGTGTFRRKPDARRRIQEKDIAFHAERQRVLLERFSRMVKPGGRLIYGTCSVLREENETVLDAFLAAHPDFSVKPVSEVLPPEVAEKLNNGPYLRLMPHLHNTDGFFGAVLVRSR